MGHTDISLLDALSLCELLLLFFPSFYRTNN